MMLLGVARELFVAVAVIGCGWMVSGAS